MRARAALAVALLVAVAGCDDGGGNGDDFFRSHEASPLAGTYVSTDDQAVTEPLGADSSALRVIATRAAALPDVSGLGLCADEGAQATPGRFVVGFQLLDHGYFEFVEVRNPGTDAACYAQDSGEYAVDGNEITTDDGRVATLASGPEPDQVTLTFAEPPLLGRSPDLGDTDPAFDTLNGTWVLPDAPGNVLRISEHPDHLEHELVRQVGAAGDAEVPFPTSCHLIYETDDYTVTATSDATGAPTTTLSYTVPRVRLVADPANGAACDTYLARRADDAAGGRLRQSWTLALDDEHLVLNGTEAHVRAH